MYDRKPHRTRLVQKKDTSDEIQTFPDNKFFPQNLHWKLGGPQL